MAGFYGALCNPPITPCLPYGSRSHFIALTLESTDDIDAAQARQAR
jgi:hypothetical protein